MSCKWWQVDCHAREAAKRAEAAVKNLNSSIGMIALPIGGIPAAIAARPAARVVVETGKGVDTRARNLKNDLNKGEIGKFTSGLADSFYNIRKAPITAGEIIKGDKDSGVEINKLFASAYNQNSLGLSSYLGQSTAYQRALTSQTAKDLTLDYSANLAGKDSAVYSANRTGMVTDADRNDVFEWFGKSAAIGAGAGLYSYLTTPQAGALASADGGGGAILIESGTAAYPEAGVVTTDLMASSGVGAEAAGAASTPWWSAGSLSSGGQLLTGGALTYSVLKGDKTPGQALSVLNPAIGDDAGGFLDDILDPIIGGGGGQGQAPGFIQGLPQVISAPVRSVLPELSENQASLASIGLLAVAGYFIYKKVS